MEFNTLLFSSFKYSLISVNPNTTNQHDSMNWRGNISLVKWKIVWMTSGRRSF